jgi:hypothetical protein
VPQRLGDFVDTYPPTQENVSLEFWSVYTEAVREMLKLLVAEGILYLFRIRSFPNTWEVFKPPRDFQQLVSRINLLSWKATAWLFLAHFHSNLNIDASPCNLLFYKEGLISQSPTHSGVSRLNRDNYIHYHQPWLSILKGILFQLIISWSSGFISLC